LTSDSSNNWITGYKFNNFSLDQTKAGINFAILDKKCFLYLTEKIKEKKLQKKMPAESKLSPASFLNS
jgi:hypothetical protein